MKFKFWETSTAEESAAAAESGGGGSAEEKSEAWKRVEASRRAALEKSAQQKQEVANERKQGRMTEEQLAMFTQRTQKHLTTLEAPFVKQYGSRAGIPASTRDRLRQQAEVRATRELAVEWQKVGPMGEQAEIELSRQFGHKAYAPKENRAEGGAPETKVDSQPAAAENKPGDSSETREFDSWEDMAKTESEQPEEGEIRVFHPKEDKDKAA